MSIAFYRVDLEILFRGSGVKCPTAREIHDLLMSRLELKEGVSILVNDGDIKGPFPDSRIGPDYTESLLLT